MNGAIATSQRVDPVVMRHLGIAEIVCLAVAAAIAATILCAWLVPAVGLLLPGDWSLMKANTAFSVLLGVLSLVLYRREHDRHSIIVAHMCATIMLLLAGASLFEQWSRHSTGLGTLLAADPDSSAPGRMTIQTALCFVLFGLSLPIDRTRTGLLGHALDALGAVLVMLILVFMAGYLFGATNIVGTAVVRMSPLTLVCLALLIFTLIIRRAPYGLFSVLVGVGIGSQFARIMLPSAVLLSFLIVRVGEGLLSSGTLTLPYTASVTGSSMAVLMAILVLLLASKINVLEAELRESSLSDDLTGLHNRRGFYLLGAQVLSDARRAGKPVSVLFFDADGLKGINDRLGHDVGSALLIDIATLLRSAFRGNDVLGRVGGDEFAVIAPGRHSDVTPALRRLDEATDVMNRSASTPYRISLSVGVLTAEPESTESLAELLDRADAAMYEAKRQRHAAQTTSAAAQGTVALAESIAPGTAQAEPVPR